MVTILTNVVVCDCLLSFLWAVILPVTLLSSNIETSNSVLHCGQFLCMVSIL